MSSDFIPKNDREYDDWLSNFVAVLDLHLADVGLVAADLEPLDTARGAFSTALTTHLTQQTAAIAATSAKNTEREETTALLRALVRRIVGQPGMTDTLRASLGLNVPGGVRTIQTAGEEVPDLFLESLPGRVVVHFGTDPANERNNGKPSWARGCNIYCKKTGETEFRYVAFETASPYIHNINGPASDYTYVVQYRGTRSTVVGGESSPMSIASSGQLAA